MWSDRPAAATRRKLVQRLRRVLPAPRPKARLSSVPLSLDIPEADVARALWPCPGFVWLDHAEAPHRVFASPIALLTLRNGAARVSGPRGAFGAEVRGFDLLEAALEAWGGPSGAVLCGYLGYELGAELEDVVVPPPEPGDPPDLWLGLYDWFLESGPRGWLHRSTNAWRTLPFELPRVRAAAGEPPAAGPVAAHPVEREFQDAVARIVERIHRGEVFQVNLCRRLEAALPASSIWPLYMGLRAASPAAQGALVRTGRRSAVLSISPELFLDCRGGLVRTCPIKGTRPRGATPEQDALLAAELLDSEKDRAELAMIVDVARNDLGRVCLPGTVEVAGHAALMTLPTLHHTYSEVTGRLRGGAGPAGLLRAAFPPASITGAPKIRAMQLAALEEGRRRGPCMGGIGWISLGGDLELSVAIRTAVASAGRVRYLAGCGITADSNPTGEYLESAAKAAAFLDALGCPTRRTPASP